MKIKSKIFLIILMTAILVCNISYAVTTSQLETSIKKLFSKNVIIEENAVGNNTTRKIIASNMTLENSQIKIVESSTGQPFYITYKLEEDICKFESIIDFNQIDDNENVDMANLQMILPTYQAAYIELCYLTTADALGIDLSLADTYFYQQRNAQNDVFTYSQSNSNNINNVKLNVNMTKLAQLDNSKIDSASSCVVTLEDVNTGTEQKPNTDITIPEEKPSTDTTTPEKQPNTNINTNTNTNTNSTQGNNQQQVSTNPNKNQTTTDIPKAGLEDNIIIAILGLSIICIIFYIKNKENKDIM